MKRWFPIAALIFGAFFMSGCTNIAGKVAGVLVKPVAMFAEADAKTTLLWIDRELIAGRLTEVEAEMAAKCPDAVMAMAALRARAAGEGVDDIKGTKGLIYLGVRAMFAKSLKDEAAMHVKSIIGSCAQLLPAEKLLGIL